jgi:hypothetical protein
MVTCGWGNARQYLETCFDQSFVRDGVHEAYPSIGRSSVDPVVTCTHYLVMVFEDIRSERQLLMLAADRFSVAGTGSMPANANATHASAYYRHWRTSNRTQHRRMPSGR